MSVIIHKLFTRIIWKDLREYCSVLSKRTPHLVSTRFFMANSPTTIVIFGASGDLTSRKLIPSLFRMDRKGRLPENIKIIGVARSPFDDESFRLKMADAIKSLSANDWNEEAWNKFAPRLGYARGDASMDGDWKIFKTNSKPSRKVLRATGFIIFPLHPSYIQK